MNQDVMKEIMEMYADITKTTIICIDSLHTNPPLFSIGLDFSSLIEFTDFKEVISFIDTELKQPTRISMEDNTFHTLYTKNFFVYNIIFIKTGKGSCNALVAGPILTFIPDNKLIEKILLMNGLSQYKRYEYVGIINNLPLASNERVYQMGKLLIVLDKTGIDNWTSLIQVFHGKKKSDELYIEHLKDTMSQEYESNELQELYKFCANLMDKITHGNVNGIIEIIGEFASLFCDMKAIGDNNRTLKNKSIILCSIACQFAIQANVPYEKMFNNLWRFVLKLEKLSTSDDIILHLAITIEGFARAVSVLSENCYSLHINRILQYIKVHFTEKITLKNLSEYIHINPIYLSSLIKKETNMSLSTHINFFRIKESKNKLIYTNKSIQEIALDVGYMNQNHFNTVFRKLEGTTPSEYRNRKGSKNHITQI